jgi:hypothetical protein
MNKIKDAAMETARREYKKFFGMKPIFMTLEAMNKRIASETKRRGSKKKVFESTPSMKEAMLRAGIVP